MRVPARAADHGRRCVAVALLVAAAVIGSACGGEEALVPAPTIPGDGPSPTASPSPVPPSPVAPSPVPLSPVPPSPVPPAPSSPGPVALERLDLAVDDPMDAHPVGDSILVAERAGTVRELVPTGTRGGYRVTGTVVDITDEVGSTDGEKGLLGLTTDTGDGPAPPGHLYLNHTRAADGATVILELPLTGAPGGLGAQAGRELLVIEQPFSNHNGGDLAWGPDGMLWIGTGDGGAGGDPGGRAQRLDTPLGKILRLDPSTDSLVPADNPYGDGIGGLATIWARGLRNPWRISFDDATGDLWIADVGQNRFEEINVLRAEESTGRGADLGWDRLEGTESFADVGPRSGWPDDDAEQIDPVHTYPHDGRCSISGGFLYRGSALAGLFGWYLFSDYCDGVIRAVSQEGEVVDLGVAGDSVVSINPDQDGEPLVLDEDGIARLVPAG